MPNRIGLLPNVYRRRLRPSVATAFLTFAGFLVSPEVSTPAWITRQSISSVPAGSSGICDWQARNYQMEVSPSKGMGLWHPTPMSKVIAAQNTREHLAIAGQPVITHEDRWKEIELFADAETTQCHYRAGKGKST